MPVSSGFTATGAQPGDGFGRSTAISGGLVVIGAPTVGATYRSGSAYVFDRATGQLMHALAPADAVAGDRFGEAIGVSGVDVLIGAPLAGNDTDPLAGAAYLFDAGTGVQRFKLSPTDSEPLDHFGASAALGVGRALIGAWADNTTAGVDAGSVYLFDTSTGVQIYKLAPADASSGARFGSSVALSGRTAVIGASHDSLIGAGGGAAYVFDAGSGAELHKLVPDEVLADAHFGWSVAVWGNLAVVGAPSDEAGEMRGAAYLFNTTTGEQLHKFSPSDGTVGDRFGISVAIGQHTALIGATFGTTYDNDLAGTAYLFDLETGQELAKLAASDSQAVDLFGGSLAMIDDAAVVGASGQNTLDGVDAGTAYLFDLGLEAPPIPGDLNGDGVVGLDDLDLVLNHWNQSVAPGDLLAGDATGDGFVGLDDLSLLLQAWNTGSPPVSDTPGPLPAAPEPVSVIIYVACAYGFMSGRGQRAGFPSR